MNELRTAEVLREIDAAIRAPDMGRAIDMARRALDDGICHPLLLNLRAYWLETQGKAAEALGDLMRARELAPQDAFVANALGECLVKLERFPEAIEAYDAALSLNPAFVRAHFNKGFACEMVRELELAERCYQRAVQLDPHHPDAHARLAGIAARRSDWARTRELADHALAHDPRSSIAIFALVAADLNDGAFDTAETRLKTVIDDTRMTDHEHANALSLLGDIRDRQNRAAEAFAAYSKANGLLLAYFSSKFGAPNCERTHDMLARIEKSFNAIPSEAWASTRNPGRAADDQSASLVFLVGFPRSGTTLLGQILASHPLIETLEEKAPMIDAIKDFFDAPGGFDRLAELDELQIAHYRDAYWRRVRGFGLHLRDRILVDKLPLNVLRLPLIVKLFPEAKIILALRDPRDVVLSCFRRLFGMHQFSYDLLTLTGAARSYVDTMRLCEAYRSKLPRRDIEIRNEDVAENFGQETRRLCEFVGVAWDKSMERFADRARRIIIGTPSAIQVARGLSQEGVGTWRRYAEQMGPVLPLLQPWVEKLGYPAN